MSGSGIEESKYNIILVLEVLIGDEEEIKLEARSSLLETLQTNKLYIEDLDINRYVGNFRGMSYG